jgi:hypothetical protein
MALVVAAFLQSFALGGVELLCCEAAPIAVIDMSIKMNIDMRTRRANTSRWGNIVIRGIILSLVNLE